jgi:ABC-type transport system involved in cytochrome c biogenesis permease subunit
MIDLTLMFLAAIIVGLLIRRTADHRGQRGVFMVVLAGILMSLTWTLIVLKHATVGMHSILGLTA